jgi:CRP/FNR family transcriptional regulator, cyclic AMP receptor protein
MTDDMDFTKPDAAKPAAPAAPEDMDFTKLASSAPAPASPSAPSAPAAPGRSAMYDPIVAMKLFKAFGKPEQIRANETFFEEHDKGTKLGIFKSASANRMYLVLKGEVSLTSGGRVLDTVKSGEIFGEMALVSQTPRSATATAKGDCQALSLDAQQFQLAIQQMPEFALMLMSVMFDRLRLVAARLSTRKQRADDRVREGQLFDAKTLSDLLAQLDRPTQLRYNAEKVIMREGEAGAYMYVVLAGRVGIVIKSTIVETIGVGGTFGEMALVDQSPRTASAFAQLDTELLAINRTSLLQLVKQHPAFGVALLKAVADRLRYMNALLAS